MRKLAQAQAILAALGFPPAQQNEMAGLTLLALCGIKPRTAWSHAQRTSLTVTKGIMQFVAEQYGRHYAPNTRETFRRQVLHQFVQGGLAEYNPDQPDLPVNSPRAHYAITAVALTTIRQYGSPEWLDAVVQFLAHQEQTAATSAEKRARHQIPVTLSDGLVVKLSPGKHNALQVAVIEDLCPHFAPGATLLYLSDTEHKYLHVDAPQLASIGVTLDDHGKLPDMILLDKARGRLLLIEVVTSHGPMTPKRIKELQSLFAGNTLSKIYLSVFENFSEFRKHLNSIAWETEVWLAEIPDHLIHFNGDQFLKSPSG